MYNTSINRKGGVKMKTLYEVTEEELEQATGAGSGWIKTLTDDCPNSIIVCC